MLQKVFLNKSVASKEEISYALKVSRMNDFVDKLKDGVNTFIGEGRNNLSIV